MNPVAQVPFPQVVGGLCRREAEQAIRPKTNEADLLTVAELRLSRNSQLIRWALSAVNGLTAHFCVLMQGYIRSARE